MNEKNSSYWLIKISSATTCKKESKNQMYQNLNRLILLHYQNFLTKYVRSKRNYSKNLVRTDNECQN